jgi:hypothetical protein
MLQKQSKRHRFEHKQRWKGKVTPSIHLSYVERNAIASDNSILSETKVQYSVVHDRQYAVEQENDWQHISSMMLYRYKKM